MLTKSRYSLTDLALWTRWETLRFLVYDVVITLLYTGAGFTFLHLPWAPISILGTAVAFVIGFQNNSAYGRIWEARTIWGGMVNSSRTWGMQTLAMINNQYTQEPVSEAELDQHRQQLIYRHIAWLTSLRHAMRQPKKWEEFSSAKTNTEWSKRICIPERLNSLAEDLKPYLSEAEQAHVLSKTNKAAAVLTLQSQHLSTLKQKGLLWEFSFLELQNLLQTFFTLQGQSERIKNFPYPRQYASLSYYFVRIFVYLLPFAAVPEFAGIGKALASSHPTAAPYFVWLAVPFCILASWVFYTMERIGRAGENPFEGTPNDVPISTISRKSISIYVKCSAKTKLRFPRPTLKIIMYRCKWLNTSSCSRQPCAPSTS